MRRRVLAGRGVECLHGWQGLVASSVNWRCVQGVLDGRLCAGRVVGVLVTLASAQPRRAAEQLEVLANPVGPDILGSGRSYPLKFRRLEGSETCWHASIANGYSTRYGEIVNCYPKNERRHPKGLSVLDKLP